MARAVRHRLALLRLREVNQIADHERRSRHPRQHPQAAHIGQQTKIAPAVGKIIGPLGLHHLHGEVQVQEVMAGGDAAVSLRHKKRRVQALAHQTPLHVREAHQHGIDLAACHAALQLVEGKHAL